MGIRDRPLRLRHRSLRYTAGQMVEIIGAAGKVIQVAKDASEFRRPGRIRAGGRILGEIMQRAGKARRGGITRRVACLLYTSRCV